MSEKLKEKKLDTSQSNKPIVIKNPLLSASITNFEDLPNMPLLLPAAPPPQPAYIPPLKEPKSLVTVGESSGIDTESLDEINLNAAPVEDLGPPAIIEPNSNSLLDPGIANDSLLSQAASSFSALPSVASSVFSSFSKRIYAGGSREQTPNLDNSNQDINVNAPEIAQLDLQPALQHQKQQQATDPTQIAPNFTQPFYASPPPADPNFNFAQTGQPEVPIPEPPKFYTPTEVPNTSAAAPPIGGLAQNTYRLTAKKKLYAPIPGLSEQSQPVPTVSTINTPLAAAISYDSSAFQQTPAQGQEERKAGGGLFSLTNLVPTGVLHNISGLVQTAAGTLGQSSKPETPTPFYVEPNQLTPHQQTPIAPIAPIPTAEESTNYPATVQTDFFTPIPPPPINFSSPTSSIQPQTTTTNLAPTASSNEGSVNFFIQPTAKTSSAPFHPIPVVPPNGAGVIVESSASPPIPQSIKSTVGFFSNPPQPQVLGETTTSSASAHPLTQPPPPPTAGQTSFRLQKGTRLYKSPLVAAETAPVFLNPQQPQQQYQQQQQHPPHTVEAPQQPPLFFNPFATTNTPSENVAESAFKAPDPNPSFAVAPPPLNTVQEIVEKSQTPAFAPFVHQTVEPKTSPNLSGNAALTPQQPTSTEITDRTTQLGPTFNIPKPTSESANIFPSSSQTPQPPTPVQSIPEATKPAVDPPSSTSSATITSAFVNLSLGAQQVPAFTGPILPPTVASPAFSSVNPYRRGTTSTTSTTAQPSLASFFTPTPSVESSSIPNFGSSIQQNFTAVSQKPQQELQQQSSEPQEPQAQIQPHPSTFDVPFNSVAPNTLPSITSFFSGLPTEAHLKQAGKQDPTNSKPSDFPTLPSYCTPTAPEAPGENEDKNLVQPTSNNASIPPPIGFANPINPIVFNKSLETHQQQSKETSTATRTFSNFFEQPSNNFQQFHPQQQQQQKQQAPDVKLQTQHVNFFDSFGSANPTNLVERSTVGAVPGIEIADSSNSSEDQVLQNFFNNPPPKENTGGAGDLNYDLVHSGLGVRKSHTGSLTTASNIVEPPSSACSEFSELNNSTSSQRVLLSQSLGANESDSTAFQTSFKAPSETLHEEKPSDEIHLLREHYKDLPEDFLKELTMANFLTNDKGAAVSPPPATLTYSPAINHWFYKRSAGSKKIWTPFSHYDSALLETSYTSKDAGSSNIVAVEGGRYDVNISERLKRPVYWEGEPIEVRRCSWFFKASDSKYVPYEEDVAQYLEEEYKKAAESGVWHRTVSICSNEQVVFHGPRVIVHFQQLPNTDNWGGSAQTTSRPRVVKRDLEDFTIEQGESQRVDHLMLMVHGIGSACDLKMRSVEEVVDDFRSIAQQLVQSHYKNSTDMGIVGRVEVLPISWHSHLHSEEMGIDVKLKSITLESIPKLRNFTNDTLLDVLFYTSPTYCQKIITTVVSAMNTLYLRYRERHPEFTGGVSLAGHSLGSLILFDLLCHQQPIKESEDKNMENPNMIFPTSDSTMSNQPVRDVTSQQISYTVGPAGTGQPFIQYAQLVFHPKKFFALGSPIGMFVTIRGIDKLGLDFRLPTCPGFYNIFHPFDPVAYRIEALVNPDMSGIRPVLIPHHKGRKRMHLELKETMARVGADLKQRFLDTFKTTLDSVNFLGSARTKKEAEDSMEKEVDEVLSMQMQMDTEHDISQASLELPTTSNRSRANSCSTVNSDPDLVEIDFPLGKLNDSKRIDYVLQEAPLEFFNEYLFALTSHVCYWDSSDTILFVMKEIYSGLGISPDSQVPQQTMTIERPNSRNSVSQSILPPTN